MGSIIYLVSSYCVTVLLQKQLKSCQDLDKLLYFSDEKKPCNNNTSVLHSEPNYHNLRCKKWGIIFPILSGNEYYFIITKNNTFANILCKNTALTRQKFPFQIIGYIGECIESLFPCETLSN